MGDARIARPAHYGEVMQLLDRHPVEALAIASVLRNEGPVGLARRQVWIYEDAVCLSGANLLPMNAGDDAARAFAARAIDEGRLCSSIVGRLPGTATMWKSLEPSWGPARAIRDRQIVMVSDTAPIVAPDPGVRHAVAADFGGFYAASIEMYIEEIQASPIDHDGGAGYRRRVSELISDRCAFVRTENGHVIFKAELGAVVPGCAQVQGVWVHPDHRGQGLGVSGTAQVMLLAREQGISTLSLAVNDYNEPAHRAYLRCGFHPVAEQMVVLF